VRPFGQRRSAEFYYADKLSKEFVPLLGGISATHTTFSQDGKWVAYTSIPDGHLWRSRVDGSERLQLTFSPNTAYSPSWSPDGKSIAFICHQPGKLGQICVISAEGGSPKVLASGDSSFRDPSWSPDGGRLAFGTTGWPLGTDERGRIEIVDLETGNISSVPGSDSIYNPHWSPDGRYLAALSFDEKKLMLYDLHSQSWKTLVIDDLGVVFPAWTADEATFAVFVIPDYGVWTKELRT
jgi:Tol biopolymer transport system component